MPSNYGDVALGLKADWDRSNFRNKNSIAGTVGHSNGVSDAFLTDEPEKRHQFTWIDPRFKDELAENIQRKYQFVKKDSWTVNEELWQWDAEGFCTWIGQRLMARPGEMHFADLKERFDSRKTERQRAEEAEKEQAERVSRRRRL